MMARPIVATRVSGASEVVLHQRTGLLVEKDDARALSDAVGYLLDNGSAAEQMGRRARRRVCEIFDWQCCVGAYRALYRTLGEKGRDQGPAWADRLAG
jgi:glycosyltransferase involved in cell wall biosynthesis